ncbi:UDP-N-acetylmuramoyl-L-alanine--D-glutamate ligase [Patescibacteria group bacterium]
MDLQKLSGKKIAILGIGIEGLSLAKFLYKHKITDISLHDKKDVYSFSKELDKLPAKPSLCLGKNYLKNLSKYDICFRSPGISSNLQELKQLYKDNKVFSTTNLFFELCPSKIIGITGTKGKGTTATALYNILKSSKKKVFLVGNIGKPALDVLDQIDSKSIVIFEMSSFQLEDIKYSPHIAVLLNLFRDHLDHHKDMQEYKDSKLRIFKFQKSTDYSIIHFQCKDLIKNLKIKSKKLYFGNADDTFVSVDKENIIINTNKTKHTFSTKNIKIPGSHNYLNIGVAGLIAKIFNVSDVYIQKTLDSFEGLEHRLEFVSEFKGVKYYNDSIATVPESTIAAIKAFPNSKILIMGGSDKGADYSDLADAISKHRVKVAILMGVTSKKIKKSLKNKDVKIIQVADLTQAVEKAKDTACLNDIVILSPASASFDMFSGYKERGKKFKETVNQLS